MPLVWKTIGKVGIGLIGAAAATSFLYDESQRRAKARRREEWAKVKENTVILHQFRRGLVCPNLSPFALKVESFLRLANIEYQVDTEEPFGSKGKCPWISVDGV